MSTFSSTTQQYNTYLQQRHLPAGGRPLTLGRGGGRVQDGSKLDTKRQRLTRRLSLLRPQHATSPVFKEAHAYLCSARMREGDKAHGGSEGRTGRGSGCAGCGAQGC